MTLQMLLQLRPNSKRLSIFTPPEVSHFQLLQSSPQLLLLLQLPQLFQHPFTMDSMDSHISTLMAVMVPSPVMVPDTHITPDILMLVTLMLVGALLSLPQQLRKPNKPFTKKPLMP